MGDQRNQLNEYERQRIRENLVKLQREQERHIKDFLAHIEEIKFDRAQKTMMDAFDQKECVICFDEFLDQELVSRIPICAHIFHRHCCASWFQSKNQQKE